MWLPYSQIKNLSQEAYQKTDNGTNVYRWEDGDKEFVKAHTKFVKRYMPELYTFDVKNYMGSKFNDSPNFGVHPYMLHLGNNLIEENLNTSKIELLRQAKLQKKIDQCVNATTDSELNGEYVARWYFGNQNNNLELEFQGLEALILENCSGVFEGKSSFQPSKNFRKDLNITFEPNGSILVSGELDLFEKGDARKTELKGDINSGEISGIWGTGDLIKIKIESKKELDEKKRVEDEKKAYACEDSSYTGEYTARWFAASTKDDVGWEFVGKENITFDGCQGQFEAMEDFQPEDWFMMSKELRRELNVNINPDGSINISGDLDLDYSETQIININDKKVSGIVSGYFNSGWLLKVELKNK